MLYYQYELLVLTLYDFKTIFCYFLCLKSVGLKTGCTPVPAHTQKSGVRDCNFSEQSCLLEYKDVLFPYSVLNQFFIITGIGERVNALPQRRAGSILIQEWQLRAPSAGSEFHFPWVLYTLNCSELHCAVPTLFYLGFIPSL